ncbi:MAG: hypothetical protein ACFFAS_14800 [Promethearchaeota archaeon]
MNDKYILYPIKDSGCLDLIPKDDIIIISAIMVVKHTSPSKFAIYDPYGSPVLITRNGIYYGFRFYLRKRTPVYIDWAEIKDIKKLFLKSYGIKLELPSDAELSETYQTLKYNFLNICESLKKKRDEFWEHHFIDKKDRLNQIAKFSKEINLEGKKLFEAYLNDMKNSFENDIIPKDDEVDAISIFTIKNEKTYGVAVTKTTWLSLVGFSKKGVIFIKRKQGWIYEGWKKFSVKSKKIRMGITNEFTLTEFPKYETKNEFKTRHDLLFSNLREIAESGKSYWTENFSKNEYKEEMNRINQVFNST